MKQNADFVRLIENFHDKIEKPKLSKTSKLFLLNIIRQIKRGAQLWQGPSGSQIIDAGSLPKGIHYKYLQNEMTSIHNYLENERHIGKHYELTIGNRSFNIFITRPSSDKRQNAILYDIMDKDICKIYLWLFVCCHYSRQVCSQTMDIYMYLTDLKKTLPENAADCLTMNHVNTAFTVPCPKGSNEIYIFRCEEWFKVFIHETLHSFGLDFALAREPEMATMFQSIFPIDSDFEFTETYAEIWGEVINLLFVSIHESSSDPVLNTNQLFKAIETDLNREQLMSIFQMVKILDHMKMKYRELFIPDNPYTEKTNVFPYYILKSVLMFHINEFFEWCHIHNDGSIQFKNENVSNFFEFVVSRSQKENYMKTIDFFESWFKKNKNGLPVMRSLRMSITE